MLGMHRSGTSLAAALLCTAGAARPAHMMLATEENETGYWEPWPLYHLNEEIFADLGMTWDSTLSLPADVLRSAKVQRLAPLYAEMLLKEYGDAPLFCTKDPRNSRLLPAILPALNAINADPKYVIITRHPLEVADSLKERGFHWGKSLILWLRHTLEAELHTRGQRRIFITYDQLMTDWRDVLRRIGDGLDVAWPRRLADIDADFERIISSRLRHHRAGPKALEARGDVAEWVARVYDACTAATENRVDDAISEFDRIRELLSIADALYEPVLADSLKEGRELKVVEQDLTERLKEREGELDAACAERDVARADADGASARTIELGGRFADAATRSDRLAGELAERQAELDAIRAQLDSARAQSVAARAEANALGALIEEREVQLAARQAELEAALGALGDERDDQLAAHLAEASALNAMIEERDDEVAAQRAEVEAVRAKLEVARTDARVLRVQVQEHGGLLDAIRDELKWVRAERDVAHEQIQNLKNNVLADAEELQQRNAELVGLRVQLDSERSETTANATLAAEHQARAEALAAQLQERAFELEALQQRASNAAGRAANRQAQIERFFGELEARDEELRQLRASAKRLEEEVAVANAESHAKRGELEKLRALQAGEKADYELRLAAAKVDLDSVRARSVAREQEFEEKARSANKTAESRDALLGEARASLNMSEAKVAELLAKASQAEIQIALLKEELSQGDESATALQELHQLQSSLKVRDGQAAQLEANVAIGRETLDAALDDLERLRRELAVSQAESSELRVRLLDLEMALNERPRSLAKLRLGATQIREPGATNGASAEKPSLSREISTAGNRDRDLSAGLCNILDWRCELGPPSNLVRRPQGRIGVFIHIYYEELAAEIASALKNIPYDFRAYVSTADRRKADAITDAFRGEGIENFAVRVLPNVGRDIGPFLIGFGDEIRQHDICLRLHSKKSTHNDEWFGSTWRRHIFAGLLSNPARVRRIVGAFLDNDDLGMVIPEHWDEIKSAVDIGGNWQLLRRLLHRMEVSIDPASPIEFPSGSMFWFRSGALESLLSLNLTLEDFSEAQERHRNFTIAHAVERSFLFSAAKAGLRWASVPSVEEAEPTVELDVADDRRDQGDAIERDVRPIESLFDEAFYRKQCPELESSGMHAQEHYLTIGAHQGKNPHPLFDTSYYLMTQPDVREAGLNPLLHFLQFGWREGRDPHPLFHMAYYVKRYPHVAQADINPLLHYVNVGSSEGLSPNPMFDSGYYLESNPDVRGTGANALAHFIEHGVAEARNPHRAFNTLQYLTEHPDVRESGLNPLIHYFRNDRADERQSRPNRSHAPPLQKRLDGLFAVERLHPAVRPLSSFESGRTVLCVSHVPPYPVRAGNEYGEYRQLAYLETHGYRIVLALCPLPGDELSYDKMRVLCERFPHTIVCGRDGTLFHALPDGDAVVQMLDGTRPEPLPYEIGEDLEPDSGEIALINLEREFCNDFLARLAIHLESALAPCVVLSQYIFQTRFLPFIGSNSLKVIQTHDMFSTTQRKVVQMGVTDILKLTSGQERRRLLRADAILSCQHNEALEFIDLVPERTVLEIPLDFDVADRVAPAEGSKILYVASDNPLNTKGLRDFLTIAWPLILKNVPEAELLVVGKICRTVEFAPENVHLLGLVDRLEPLYEQARVTINPSVAGTGLKIKNAEALSRFRPVVSWPSGVDGFQPELAELCQVAYDWPEFAGQVVRILRDPRKDWFSTEQRSRIRDLLSADTIYEPVLQYLDAYCERNEIPAYTTQRSGSQL